MLKVMRRLRSGFASFWACWLLLIPVLLLSRADAEEASSAALKPIADVFEKPVDAITLEELKQIYTVVSETREFFSFQDTTILVQTLARGLGKIVREDFSNINPPTKRALIVKEVEALILQLMDLLETQIPFGHVLLAHTLFFPRSDAPSEDPEFSLYLAPLSLSNVAGIQPEFVKLSLLMMEQLFEQFRALLTYYYLGAPSHKDEAAILTADAAKLVFFELFQAKTSHAYMAGYFGFLINWLGLSQLALVKTVLSQTTDSNLKAVLEKAQTTVGPGLMAGTFLFELLAQSESAFPIGAHMATQAHMCYGVKSEIEQGEDPEDIEIADVGYLSQYATTNVTIPTYTVDGSGGITKSGAISKAATELPGPVDIAEGLLTYLTFDQSIDEASFFLDATTLRAMEHAIQADYSAYVEKPKSGDEAKSNMEWIKTICDQHAQTPEVPEGETLGNAWCLFGFKPKNPLELLAFKTLLELFKKQGGSFNPHHDEFLGQMESAFGTAKESLKANLHRESLIVALKATMFRNYRELVIEDPEGTTGDGKPKVDVSGTLRRFLSVLSPNHTPTDFASGSHHWVHTTLGVSEKRLDDLLDSEVVGTYVFSNIYRRLFLGYPFNPPVPGIGGIADMALLLVNQQMFPEMFESGSWTFIGTVRAFSRALRNEWINSVMTYLTFLRDPGTHMIPLFQKATQQYDTDASISQGIVTNANRSQYLEVLKNLSSFRVTINEHGETIPENHVITFQSHPCGDDPPSSIGTVVETDPIEPYMDPDAFVAQLDEDAQNRQFTKAIKVPTASSHLEAIARSLHQKYVAKAWVPAMIKSNFAGQIADHAPTIDALFNVTIPIPQDHTPTPVLDKILEKAFQTPDLKKKWFSGYRNAQQPIVYQDLWWQVPVIGFPKDVGASLKPLFEDAAQRLMTEASLKHSNLVPQAEQDLYKQVVSPDGVIVLWDPGFVSMLGDILRRLAGDLLPNMLGPKVFQRALQALHVTMAVLPSQYQKLVDRYEGHPRLDHLLQMVAKTIDDQARSLAMVYEIFAGPGNPREDISVVLSQRVKDLIQASVGDVRVRFATSGTEMSMADLYGRLVPHYILDQFVALEDVGRFRYDDWDWGLAKWHGFIQTYHGHTLINPTTEGAVHLIIPDGLSAPKKQVLIARVKAFYEIMDPILDVTQDPTTELPVAHIRFKAGEVR